MFFEKPNVRYVDMCIYIDDHIYTDDYDETLVYQYLYHIIRMITIKRNYFTCNSTIDDFSIFAASNYYMRLTDPRQLDGRLPQVRSVLNYIRKTLFSVRRDYAKKYINTQEITSSELVNLDMDAFEVYVNKKIDPTDSVDFKGYIANVQHIIREYLKGIPYPYGTTVWNNIYISCMLSFLNSITLKNRDVERIKNFRRPESLSDRLLTELYQSERYNSTILYHLDDSMYTYITVLTNKIRHKLAKELSQSLRTNLPSCVNIKNLLMATIQENQGD